MGVGFLAPVAFSKKLEYCKKSRIYLSLTPSMTLAIGIRSSFVVLPISFFSAPWTSPVLGFLGFFFDFLSTVGSFSSFLGTSEFIFLGFSSVLLPDIVEAESGCGRFCPVFGLSLRFPFRGGGGFQEACFVYSFGQVPRWCLVLVPR